jgi:hypothetical protein
MVKKDGKTTPKHNEYIARRNLNTGEIDAKQVQNGTLNAYKARVIAVKKGISFGGFQVEELYDLQKKIYSPRKMSGDNLISFRPCHTQELKTSLANAHESDPYMKRITQFYTDYTFGDEIKPVITPMASDKPKSRKENDDLVREVISKTEHEGFMKFISDVNYMSDVHAVLKGIWHQSYIFGMAAAWKTLSLKEMISVRKGNKVRIPLGTPITFKPIDGYYLTYIHQDVDTFKPKFYEYLNPNSQLTFVKNVKGEDVLELSLRPNTKINDQFNMLPWERLLIVKRPNIGTTPNTSVYGVSPILPILYISENIRRIDEKILPELNEGSYAGVGIFSIEQDSKYDIDKLAQDLSTAGTRIVLNEPVTYEPIQVDFNMEHILNQKVALIKSELLALGLPESIFFPTNTNRSVLEILINVWQNVDLQKERDALTATMWNYWYRDLMQVYFPDEELLDLAITVTLQFKNKTFAGFVDKAAPTLEAYKIGALNKMETREMLDHDPISEFDDQEQDIPLIAIEKAKAEAVGEQQRKTQKEAPKPPAAAPQLPSPTTAATTTTSGTVVKTKKPTTVRDTTKSITKVSQNTSRSN